MLHKLPEEMLFEVVVYFKDIEIATYYSDAPPPEIGAKLEPWEFIDDEAREQQLKFQGPFQVIEVTHQPKNMEGGEISTQTLVNIRVEKSD